MEEGLYELESYSNELELKKLIITIIKIYNTNYFKKIYDFFYLFKIRVIKQIIYENKYIINYKRLYALRNIIVKTSLLLYNKNNFKKITFDNWYNNSKLINSKYNRNSFNHFLKIKKDNYLTKVILKIIMKNIKNKYNARITKKYFLLLIKYYNHLLDKYYIKSITITKAIFNFVKIKLKPYKARFFSRIDYYLDKDDINNIYKYILLNYLKDNNNRINNNEIISLINNYNKNIKLNYENLISRISRENGIYTILYKTIFNNFFINKNISYIFSIWKQNSLDDSFIYIFHRKETLTNNLIFSKIYMLVLVVKKRLKKYFEFLYNNIYRKQTNGLILLDSYELLSILNFESLYDNYLFKILQGLYKLQNYNNMKNSRIFHMNNNNMKLISLNKWKNNHKVIYSYYNIKNRHLFNNKIDIIKGTYIFNNIYLLSYNKRIINLINNILIYYTNNQNKKLITLKINIFLEILQRLINNNQRKKIFNNLFEIFKLSEDEKILKYELSYVTNTIQNAITSKNLKYKRYFLQKFINYYNQLKILKPFYYNIKNKYEYNIKKIKDKKLIALNDILKYFINNTIKNNFPYTLRSIFNRWSSLIGYCPKTITEKYNYNNNSEDEEDIITQRKEIKELHKCLKEDQDFQHDLKAKITALDEENTFICEKIYDITQRVEKCDKCSNLLKSSNISDNNLRSSYGSMIKSIHGNKKSRNIAAVGGTSSSGLNFASAGTELVPRKPQGSLNIYEEASDPGSDQMDDIDENQSDNNTISQPYLIGIKQKIMDLKKEKDPIINKLKDEIKALYLELNMI